MKQQHGSRHSRREAHQEQAARRLLGKGTVKCPPQELGVNSQFSIKLWFDEAGKREDLKDSFCNKKS